MNEEIKVKGTVTMSLEDYEKLKKEIETSKKLLNTITSSEYADYEIDEDYSNKRWVEGKKYCKFTFDSKKFIKDNFKYFSRNTDKLLKMMKAETIEFIIKD